ncbi:MAG: AAA family ATPase [Planctomycetes bacterium]|nr:AAA family ATPase [Planctomycetota bacterium]
MDRTLHVLVVGADPSLLPEFEAAADGVRRVRLVAHGARDLRAGVEAARARTPDLVIAQMDRDVRPLRTFAEEIAAEAPDAVVAAAYRPDDLRDTGEGQLFIEAMRARVQDFLRRPLSSGELQQLIDRVSRQPSARTSVGSVVSVVSNKGGVGKSTVAVNVASALAKRAPDRVLLIDASLQMGTCASMLDLAPETTLTDAVREFERLDETLLRQIAEPHPCGLRLLAAPADAGEAYEVEAEAMARIISLARRAFDHVVVDTFPLLDNVVMAILDLSDEALVVTNGTVPTVVGTAKLLETLTRLGVPPGRQRVVLNLNHPTVAGGLSPSDVAARLDRDVAHVLPYDKRQVTAVNMGTPYVLQPTRLLGWRWSRAMDRLVDAVAAVRPSVGGRVPATNGALRGWGPPPHPESGEGPLRRTVESGRLTLADSYVILPPSGRLPTPSGRLYGSDLGEVTDHEGGIAQADDDDPEGRA